METLQSEIPLNYTTIRTTKGRIGKDLLAIPVSLIDLFPKKSGKIYVVDSEGIVNEHRFTAKDTSTRECRIYGMKQFYSKYHIQDGDELVLQKMNDDTFRLLPEINFQGQYQQALTLFEESEDDSTVQQTLTNVGKLANIDSDKIIENEFIKLASSSNAPSRITTTSKGVTRREIVLPYLRKILQTIYAGKCQITQFTFFKRNGNPYFEVHHIQPNVGNHIKNLLVVCPNVHAQFTHADTEHLFDTDGWLRQVKFNGMSFNVIQKIDTLHKTFVKEVHF
jgi:predicted HNH restriction endonuclease